MLKKMPRRQHKSNGMIIVFYDGKCGLCSKEINYYRRVAPDNVFDWQDITKSTDGLKKANIQLCEGLKLLHVQDNNGRIHVGVDAFIVIWKQLQHWRILAAFVALPLIRQIANLAYKTFASWRFKRLAHCQLVVKNEGKS